MTLSRCVELLRKAKRKTLNKIRVNVKDYVAINAKRNMRNLKGEVYAFLSVNGRQMAPLRKADKFFLTLRKVIWLPLTWKLLELFNSAK